MHKETSDKLLIAEGNRMARVTWLSAVGSECCVCIRDRNDSAVRDSNLVGVASKIFDYIAKSIECFFFCRNKGQIGIKLSHRKLCIIPRLMKNIKSEKRSWEMATLITRLERSRSF